VRRPGPRFATICPSSTNSLRSQQTHGFSRVDQLRVQVNIIGAYPLEQFIEDIHEGYLSQNFRKDTEGW
jgi:hypothetical protein